MKKLLKKFIPQSILKKYQDINKKYGFFGDYKDWEEAKRETTGYDSEKILAKVKGSLLKVKNGEATYERDSVLFDKIEYSWPLLACLLYVASVNDNKLNVLDFGGSLGSSYYQNKKFLSHLKELHWNIVEQENFVRTGQESFQNGQLKFYSTIEESSENQKPDVLLLSSVIQYLEDPYEFIEKIKCHNIPYIIFDRTAFMKDTGRERLTVQKVNPRIYPASYPAWFLDINKLKEMFKNKYELIADFDSLDLGVPWAQEKGLFFKKIR